MSRCADGTHGDTGATEMIMNNVRSKVQLCADLAQGPALGIQLCRTLNVHHTTCKVSRALESALCRRKPMSDDTVPALVQSQCFAEVSDAPDFEDVVVGAIGVAEMADSGAGAAGFDGGFCGWVPHDHHMADVIGSKVGVPKD